MFLENPTIRKILDKKSARKKVIESMLIKDFRKFGFNKQFLTRKYETVEEMKKSIPGVVLAESVSNAELRVGSEVINLKSGDLYIMPLDFYIRGFTNGEFFYLKPYKQRFEEYFRRYLGYDLNNKKILIWRVGGLGDLIFSQPLVQFLKKTYPSCYIGFATAPENRFLFKAWPDGLIDDISIIPFKLDYFSKFDYHLTFEGAIERCKESEKVNCYDIFKRVANVDFDVRDYLPRLILDQEEVNKFKRFVPDNTILIQMRASSPLRMMATRKWIKIINKLAELGFHVAVIDSQDNQKMYDEFLIQQFGLKNKLTNLSKFSKTIYNGIHMLANCKGFIGIDSSFTHIAPAIGIPSVGIYGPFLGDLRMRYYKNADWVDASNYDNICGRYPCFFHQSKVEICPYYSDHQPVGCLNSISENEVINKLLNLLNSQKEK